MKGRTGVAFYYFILFSPIYTGLAIVYEKNESLFESPQPKNIHIIFTFYAALLVAWSGWSGWSGPRCAHFLQNRSISSARSGNRLAQKTGTHTKYDNPVATGFQVFQFQGILQTTPSRHHPICPLLLHPLRTSFMTSHPMVPVGGGARSRGRSWGGCVCCVREVLCVRVVL